MFNLTHNPNPNKFYDATVTLGQIAELTEEAVAEWLTTAGRLYEGAQVVDFEVDADYPGHADAAILIGSRMVCLDIRPE